MIKIIKQEIKINYELKKKVEWSCKLNNTKPIFINGGLLKLEPTNIGYLEPHRAIINGRTYLLFNRHELVKKKNEKITGKYLKICMNTEYLVMILSNQ